MKLLIAGSREITEILYLRELLSPLLETNNITEVISGLARGVDTLALEWAGENNLPSTLFPANWPKYGRGAGHFRNWEMGEYCDIALVLWDGVSKGSLQMITVLRELKKPKLVATLYEQKLEILENALY